MYIDIVFYLEVYLEVRFGYNDMMDIFSYMKSL